MRFTRQCSIKFIELEAFLTDRRRLQNESLLHGRVSARPQAHEAERATKGTLRSAGGPHGPHGPYAVAKYTS